MIFAVREGIISDLRLLNNVKKVLVVFRVSLLLMVQSYNNDRFWLVMLSRLSYLSSEQVRVVSSANRVNRDEFEIFGRSLM